MCATADIGGIVPLAWQHSSTMTSNVLQDIKEDCHGRDLALRLSPQLQEESELKAEHVFRLKTTNSVSVPHMFSVRHVAEAIGEEAAATVPIPGLVNSNVSCEERELYCIPVVHM